MRRNICCTESPLSEPWNLGIGLEISPIYITPEKLQSASNKAAASEPLLCKASGAAVRARA